jgi:16S rRNA A1518/A1519 N6-dimethyltransferase RsmA/KsgA/DIM1 with predicted DNA glycosylase/AP lyase activity
MASSNKETVKRIIEANHNNASSIVASGSFQPVGTVQNGGGVNRHFFKPANKVVKGVFGLKHNVQNEGEMSGSGINQFTHSVEKFGVKARKTAGKLDKLAKEIKNIPKDQKGEGLGKLTKSIASKGNKLNELTNEVKSQANELKKITKKK